MNKKYQIAAYYFPNFHVDVHNEKWHGKGWTEWELVKRAEPRFEGHRQPKILLWGYEDEANPKVMAKKINTAADNGLTAFIFDWYWHEKGPYLQRCLEDGFLKAKNNSRLKFALMWANHDWFDIHPATRERSYATLACGEVSEKSFIEATKHMIRNYFRHPSYWKINGGLYFSIYELMSFVKGLGGIDNTKKVLNDFRTRVRTAGLGELHLNAVIWEVQILPGEKKITNPNEMLEMLGFDSVTSYVWIHHVPLVNFPNTSYAWCREQAVKNYERFTELYSMPYFPNVTVGWDPSPRTIQSDAYDNLGYPFMPILDGNTPDEFKKALKQVKTFLDRRNSEPKIFILNAWNKWTEGSYLEPDTVYGMKYLEAIKEVFSK
jgi:hypothetical protein